MVELPYPDLMGSPGTHHRSAYNPGGRADLECDVVKCYDVECIDLERIDLGRIDLERIDLERIDVEFLDPLK